MKKNELKKLFKSAITSKILLYTISLISFANLLYFLNENYLGGIVIFLFVGLLSHHYTNNMIIILFLSIIFSNLLVIVANVCNKNSKKEGMTSKDSTTNGTSSTDASTDASTDNTSTDASTDASTDNTSTDASNGTNTTSSENGKPLLLIQPTLPPEEESGDEDSTTENLTNLSDPHRKNSSAIKRTNDTSLENAQMLKDVQGQLQTLIGGNGIQNLDTTELLKQQKELMLAIKQMQPLIDGATGMMDKISGSGIGSLLGMNKKNNDK